jgi:hypothetical protein
MSLTGLTLCGVIVLAGCASKPLAKQAAAISNSLAPVVDQSAAAYHDAAALDNLRNDYEAVIAYQQKDATYNPRNVPDLLSEKDIQARLAVLAALQVYSQSLVEITKGADSAELDTASKSVGTNLASVGNDLAPSLDHVLGITAAVASKTTTTVTTVAGNTTSTTTSSSSTHKPMLSPEERNGISTAINALGQFLISRTVNKELPGKIEEMGPHIQALCKELSDDIGTLQELEHRDYDRILNLEKQFILEDERPGSNVDPQQHRAEIMKLPEIARQQRGAEEKLIALRGALDKLASTHQALVAEVKNNNPESMRNKLGDLAEAGTNLGKFYSSLPTTTK